MRVTATLFGSLCLVILTGCATSGGIDPDRQITAHRSSTTMTKTSRTTERRFALPHHGSLVMQIPYNWKHRVHQPSDDLPPTITFTPKGKALFEALFTPVWPATDDDPLQSPDRMRALVEQSAQAVSARAVEPQLPIIEFQGNSGHGFYFSATDRSPKPGEHRFMMQGILRVGRLSMTFTVLTQDSRTHVLDQVLDVAKSTMHENDDEGALRNEAPREPE